MQAQAPLGRPTCKASRRTSSFAGRCCSACSTKRNPSAGWAERQTHIASRRTCVCVQRVPVPPRCALHSTACASALCAADGSSGSRATCSTLRPAGAIVHDEARGEGALLKCECCVGPPARWIGEHRQRAPTAHPSTPAARGGMGHGVGGAVSRRAECTCLSPASYSARFPKFSAYCFGVRLHARGCCGFRFGCAAQRSVTPSGPGRPRRRRAAAAPRRLLNGHWPRHSAAAWPCTADGGGDSADRTQRPICRKRKRRTRSRSGRSRRRRMRRAIGRFGDCRSAPQCAAR